MGLGLLVPLVVLLELVPDPDPEFVPLLEPAPLPAVLPVPEPVLLLEPVPDDLLKLDAEATLPEALEDAVEFRPVVEVELRETKMPPAI